MITDERLRAAYGRAVDARARAGRAGCVTPEEMLALVRREGPEAGRLATLDHVMACAACRDEFELLRSIDRAGGAGTTQAVEQLRWKRNLSMAIAASAILAIGVGTGRQLMNGGGREVVRSASGSEIRLLQPAASETLASADSLVFRWEGVPGTRGYTFELLTPDGGVALARETRDTVLRVALPVAGDGDYLWTVRSVGEDGTEWRSDARPLRLR